MKWTVLSHELRGEEMKSNVEWEGAGEEMSGRAVGKSDYADLNMKQI